MAKNLKMRDKITIKCKKCRAETEIDINQMKHKSEEFERSIGYETEHEYRYICNCPECNNKIIVIALIYLYPENYHNTTIIEGSGFFKGIVEEELTPKYE